MGDTSLRCCCVCHPVRLGPEIVQQHQSEVDTHGCRAATRAEEELSPYLPPNKRAYVFGTLAAQAARLVMWLLPELKVRGRSLWHERCCSGVCER